MTVSGRPPRPSAAIPIPAIPAVAAMVACVAVMSVVAVLQVLADHPDRNAIAAGFVVVMIAWCGLLAMTAVVVGKRRQQAAARRPQGAQLAYQTSEAWPATRRDEGEEMSR